MEILSIRTLENMIRGYSKQRVILNHAYLVFGGPPAGWWFSLFLLFLDESKMRT